MSISNNMIYMRYPALMKLIAERASIEKDIQINSMTKANRFSEYGFTYVLRTDG
jgi:hypothetical protein